MLFPLLLALAFAPGPQAPPPAAPPPPQRDFDVPPAGSPAEQALWRRAYETNNRVVVDRTVATRLQLRAKVVTERLRALSTSGALPPDRARALEAEVLEAWNVNLAVTVERWPVDPIRACRYDWLHYDSAMQVDPAKGRAEGVADARRSLEACLEKADAVLKKLGAANRELEHEVTEAEKAAGEASPPVTPAAAPPARGA